MPRPLLLVAGAYVLISCGWVAASPAISEENCPPLVEPTRKIECKLKEELVDCEKPMAPGTNAVLTCNPFYSDIGELAKYVLSCQAGGIWSHPVKPCIPICGEIKPSIGHIRGYHYWWYLTNNSVADTTVADTAVDIPWHAAIYKDIDGNYKLICGGTIISERLIVTAAHCFWDYETQLPKNQTFFQVAVGKLYSDWYTKEENAQLPKIDKIILHSRFGGDILNYAHDISVVRLKKPLQMTIAVRPICVDFNKMYETKFYPGKFGVVVGWGENDKQIYNETIRKLILPYVHLNTCEKNVKEPFSAFLTQGKFCAGYLNGTSLCPADGGGGFASQFDDNGKWYLTGVVSVSTQPTYDYCNFYAYTTLTMVSSYVDFLKLEY